ncbi:hypothetical protein GHT06_020516 [Daphnia sinensis]|uniref:Uncharacterized protein n=1 Tax=Daphnia sinensis TaxID=1820382 RepID=A0AAD5PRL8_9CRUS|nr:hypothetical protein GHT06_020516 [Daphnia sinensis]
MNQILQWLHQLADSLNIGFSLLANGHLAPQIITPARFNAVIKNVNRQLPKGWSISSDELWVAYREATVSIPIFDLAQQYKLFQIISLPGAADNGTHSVSFSNLPDFLAVAADLETFLELSKDDVRDERNARKSCAIAVFMNDIPRIKTQCRKKFADWRGPEVVYIGANQWAFSATKPHDIVLSCPALVGQPPLRPITLPAVGIFEVPLGCTARTEDWVFPASMEGNIEAPNLQAVVLPPVDVFSQDPTSNSSRKHIVIEIPRENTSSIDIISELLRRNDRARLAAEMKGKQIHNLVAEVDKHTDASPARYPYEIIIAMLLLSIGIALLTYKFYLLSERLAAHEQLDVVSLPPGDRGREELEMQNL